MSVIGTNECTKCTGLGGCSKYCAKQAGRSLADYLVGLDTVQTDIGGIRKPSRKGDRSLIVIGHQSEEGSEVNIMRELDSSISIQSTDKFKKFYGKKTSDVLKSFTDTLDSELYTEQIGRVKDIIRGINSNKTMVIPFKFNSDVIVYDDKYSKEEIDGVLKCVIWKVDKDTSRIQGKLMIVPKVHLMGNVKIMAVDLCDYGTKVKLKVVTEALKTSEIQEEVIKFTQEGMVRPIVIKTKSTTLAIDGKYLYQINGEGTKIIGIWTDKGLEESEVSLGIKRTNAYKKIKSTLKYIEMHRKLIAPLGIVEENIIEL